jgi:hypothetical protein
MKTYPDKSVLFCDGCGLFIPWAEKISEGFGASYYFNNYIDVYPSFIKYNIGYGLFKYKPKSIFEISKKYDYRKIDLFVFLDNGYMWEAELLKSMGKRVFSCFQAENLELSREFAIKKMQEVGLPTIPTEFIHGFDDLKEYLEQNDRKYVKVSEFRDIFESWEHENFDQSEQFLLDKQAELGLAASTLIDVLVQDMIESDIEIGATMYNIDGQHPNVVSQDIEIKDKLAIGKLVDWDDLIPQVKDSYEKLAEYFEETECRMVVSNEVRIDKKGNGYTIDWTTRIPSPAGGIVLSLIDNWPEIVWEGADGNLVEPEFKHRYGIELVFGDHEAADSETRVEFDEKYRDNVKLYCHYRVNKKDYVAPATGWDTVGTIVYIGDSVKECEEGLRKVVKEIGTFARDLDLNVLGEIEKELEAIKKETGFDYYK